MKTILAATDLSERSATALQRAAAVAKSIGADLLIVHAVDDSLPKRILGQRTKEAEKALLEEAKAIAGAKVRCEVVVGDIFWALHRTATNARADLIVVGDHRRSPLRDLFRDTTVERLIRVTAVPVLIARNPVSSPYHHALVGVESEEGRELIQVLADFGAAAPERATVLHAVSAPAEGLLYYAGADRAVREDYRASITQEARSRLRNGLRATGIPVRIRIADAPPARAIVEFAERAGCDIVAVSSHARRYAARAILGSVSSELIRRGSSDLLIVPRVVSEREYP